MWRKTSPSIGTYWKSIIFGWTTDGELYPIVFNRSSYVWRIGKSVGRIKSEMKEPFSPFFSLVHWNAGLQVRSLSVDPSGRLIVASDNLGRVGQAAILKVCMFPNFVLVSYKWPLPTPCLNTRRNETCRSFLWMWRSIALWGCGRGWGKVAVLFLMLQRCETKQD